MRTFYRLLFIEDSEEDYLLMKRAIDGAGFAYIDKRVLDVNALKEELNTSDWDIFILDHEVPGTNVKEFLEILCNYDELVPIILVSGVISEDQVATALQYGARDYVMKDNLRRLPNVISREIDIYYERRKFRQAQIEKSELIQQHLKAQGILIKEIHHRVKNNLQIISSLLELQAFQIKDDATKVALLDSQNRVKSMALVHEKIYQSEDLSSINYKEYMEQLTEYLFTTHKQPNVTYSIDSDDINMSIDSAIPAGIIINELITNSLKHAFPDGRSGSVEIKLKNNDDGLLLVVQDNGVGIPKDFELSKTSTLGLELVNALSQQLSANVIVDSSRGTRFSFQIPWNES